MYLMAGRRNCSFYLAGRPARSQEGTRYKGALDKLTFTNRQEVK